MQPSSTTVLYTSPYDSKYTSAKEPPGLDDIIIVYSRHLEMVSLLVKK